MKRLTPILLFLFLPVLTFAHGGVDEVSKSIQASMLVSGSIIVSPDGSVQSYSIDHQELLPSPVVQLIGKTVTGWKFQPVLMDGKSVMAKAPMNLRVVAKPDGKDSYAISISGVSFGQEKQSDADPSWKSMKPPTFPLNALRDGVSGTVYVVVMVDRDGRVGKAAVERTDLRKVGDETEMGRWRRMFENAALTSATDWSFNFPANGDAAKVDRLAIRIPINFSLSTSEPAYGQWQTYVPGPVEQISWLAPRDQLANGGQDAIPNGVAFVNNSHLVFRNSASGG